MASGMAGRNPITKKNYRIENMDILKTTKRTVLPLSAVILNKYRPADSGSPGPSAFIDRAETNAPADWP